MASCNNLWRTAANTEITIDAKIGNIPIIIAPGASSLSARIYTKGISNVYNALIVIAQYFILFNDLTELCEKALLLSI